MGGKRSWRRNLAPDETLIPYRHPMLIAVVIAPVFTAILGIGAAFGQFGVTDVPIAVFFCALVTGAGVIVLTGHDTGFVVTDEYIEYHMGLTHRRWARVPFDSIVAIDWIGQGSGFAQPYLWTTVQPEMSRLIRWSSRGLKRTKALGPHPPGAVEAIPLDTIILGKPNATRLFEVLSKIGLEPWPESMPRGSWPRSLRVTPPHPPAAPTSSG